MPLPLAAVEKLLERTIDYRPATKPDAGYEDLRKKFVGTGWDEVHSSAAAAAAAAAGGAAAPAPEPEQEPGQLEAVDPSLALFDDSQLAAEWPRGAASRGITPGLDNMANTCFLNSTLQCLLYCPILSNYLQSAHHSRQCSAVGFCAFCALERLANRLLGGNKATVLPKELVLNVRTMGRQFRRGRQEDAHEFLRCLLDSMQKACLRLVAPKRPRRVQETSAVHSLFGGHLRSQVKCRACGHCSNKSAPPAHPSGCSS